MNYDLINENSKLPNINNSNETDIIFKETTIVELFERQVNLNSDEPAVIYQNESITYAKLDEKANMLAAQLRKLGITPNEIVPIIAERSIEVIIGIMGIIKSGAAYLPIDPEYPEERINFMIKDSNAKVALIYKTAIKILIPVINLEKDKTFSKAVHLLPKVNKPQDLAYCIYTSGTTGKPKGVLIEHRNVLNLVTDNKLNVMREIFVSKFKKILSMASISFDMFVAESLFPLLNGMTIYIANPEEQQSSTSFSELQKNYQNEVLQSTPSRIKMWLNDSRSYSGLKYLKLIIIGGEKLERELVEKLSKITQAKLLNIYGPTETTVWATRYEINPNDISKEIPIGKPINNMRVYIIDKDNNEQEFGEVGELCISGAGVGRGYLNSPELMEQKFIDHSDFNKRIYKTGDMARWRADGNIEFIGRDDEQAKIRGYRIELGEIEKVLKEIPEIDDVHILVRKDKFGDRSIMAFIVSKTDLDKKNVLQRISKKLPKYMLPSFISFIDKIPLTLNNKVDQKALEKIRLENKEINKSTKCPVEKDIMDIWKEILQIKQIGTEESFFEIGGHSLLAERMLILVNQLYGTDMTMLGFMSVGSTISELSALVKQQIIEEAGVEL